MAPVPDFDLIKKSLESRFKELWKRCVLPGQHIDLDHTWQVLSQHYGEPHRLYHTLYHIDYCLHEFDLAKSLMDSAQAVEMAIWYHDVIYQPQARDNEYQSQLLFEQVGKNNLEPHFIKNVGDLIMVTTHLSTPKTKDQEYFCDIDLSSLGALWEKFISDSNALRAESEASAEEYTLGKLKFFSALLQRPRIYYSDYFHSQYENTARQNIQRYVLMLNQLG